MNDRISKIILDNLIKCITNDDVEGVHALYEKYPTLAEKYYRGYYPIHTAVKKLSDKCLEFIIDKDKILNRLNEKNQTSLEYAICLKQTNTAIKLINQGVAIGKQTRAFMALIDKNDFCIIEDNGRYYLHRNADQSCISKAKFYMKLGDENNKVKVLQLMDAFVQLHTLSASYTRAKKHSEDSKRIDNMIIHAKKKTTSLLNIISIGIIGCATDFHYILPLRRKNALDKISNLLTQQSTESGRYYATDLSDDSDEEQATKFIKNQDDEKVRQWRDWQKACTETVLLKANVKQISKELKNIVQQFLDNDIDDKEKCNKLKDLQSSMIKDLKGRGYIQYTKDKLVKAEFLKNIYNVATPNERERILQENKIWIMGARGINYMPDRWSALKRREHRKLNELEKEQYSENILMHNSDKIYIEVGRDNKENYLAALKLRTFWKSLYETENGKVIEKSPLFNKPYVYDSAGDWLQDCYSNGVDALLNKLVTLKKEYPEFWGIHLKNTFNPMVSVGLRIYHALKYAYGMKDYRSGVMRPRYNLKSPENHHIGKIYLTLHPLLNISDTANNISTMDKNSQIALSDIISPEKELTFPAFLPKNLIVEQLVAKFPDFSKPWTQLSRVKYGFDEEMYKNFGRLLSMTMPYTEMRNTVIDTIAEWFCCYHECMLIEIALNKATQQNGFVFYLDRDGEIALEPDNGRIFTKGENNLHLRNKVHTLRRWRLTLAQHIEPKSTVIPGIKDCDWKAFEDKKAQVLTDASIFSLVSEKIRLSHKEEAEVLIHDKDEKHLIKHKALDIIQKI